LPPELRNILIVPVAPHLSMDRPIVLSEGATVHVVASDERAHHLSVIADGGELCEVRPKDQIMIQAGKNVGMFVRMREKNYFYRSLLDRLEPRLPTRATPDQLQLKVHTDSNEG
jgi:NAD+ kinase